MPSTRRRRSSTANPIPLTTKRHCDNKENEQQPKINQMLKVVEKQEAMMTSRRSLSNAVSNDPVHVLACHPPAAPTKQKKYFYLHEISDEEDPITPTLLFPVNGTNPVDCDLSVALKNSKYSERFHLLRLDSATQPNLEAIRQQTQINTAMRAMLVDWLLDVCTEFGLARRTFHLTIQLLDRYLSLRVVPRQNFQLLGSVCLLLATYELKFIMSLIPSKMEEIKAVSISDLLCLSEEAFTADQVRQCECDVLRTLQWRLNKPTLFTVLEWLHDEIQDEERSTWQTMMFLAELSCLDMQSLQYNHIVLGLIITSIACSHGGALVEEKIATLMAAYQSYSGAQTKWIPILAWLRKLWHLAASTSENESPFNAVKQRYVLSGGIVNVK